MNAWSQLWKILAMKANPIEMLGQTPVLHFYTALLAVPKTPDLCCVYYSTSYMYIQ